ERPVDAVYLLELFLFFFSSRRRHTRFSRDWSSDVCSSDLYSQVPWFWSDQYDLKLQIAGLSTGYTQAVVRGDPATGRSFAVFYQIGRASCREREEVFEDATSL